MTKATVLHNTVNDKPAFPAIRLASLRVSWFQSGCLEKRVMFGMEKTTKPYRDGFFVMALPCLVEQPHKVVMDIEGHVSLRMTRCIRYVKADQLNKTRGEMKKDLFPPQGGKWTFQI